MSNIDNPSWFEETPSNFFFSICHARRRSLIYIAKVAGSVCDFWTTKKKRLPMIKRGMRASHDRRQMDAGWTLYVVHGCIACRTAIHCSGGEQFAKDQLDIRIVVVRHLQDCPEFVTRVPALCISMRDDHPAEAYVGSQCVRMLYERYEAASSSLTCASLPCTEDDAVSRRQQSDKEAPKNEMRTCSGATQPATFQNAFQSDMPSDDEDNSIIEEKITDDFIKAALAQRQDVAITPSNTATVDFRDKDEQ